MIYLKFTLVYIMSAVWAAGLVQAWDLGVVTQTRILLFSNGKINTTVKNHLESMDKAVYDPIKKHIYVSDLNQEVGSIFRIKTIGNTAPNVAETIIAKQTHDVEGMAFDYLTSTLYWIIFTKDTISYVHVPNDKIMVPLTGQVLLRTNRGFLKGIAIDVHRRYLYWANSDSHNSTIERSRPDGSGRQVLVVHGDLTCPGAVTLDAEDNALYWLVNRDSVEYSIQSMDLRDNGTRRTLVRGLDYYPFAIAFDDRHVYWNDWKSSTVWKMPKDSSRRDVSPSPVYWFMESDLPLGLFELSGGDSNAGSKDMPLDFSIFTTLALTVITVNYSI